MTGSTTPSEYKPYLIGVSGGSGSGKTYFAKALRDRLGASACELIYQDNFYIDQSARFDRDGGAVNFDHPDAIDHQLLVERLKLLKLGQSVDIPIYDFVTHKRKTETLRAEPRPIVVIDGILIFHWPEVRELFDERIFFATPEPLRFQRRLDRDVRERGRLPEGVREQFLMQVKPMHDAYVEPSKIHAHALVDDSGRFDEFLTGFVQKLSKVTTVTLGPR